MVVHKIVRAVIGSIGVCVIGFTIVAVFAVWSGYRLNASSSAPVGIWKISEVTPGELAVGEYVLICPPEHDVLRSLLRQGRMWKGSCESGTVPFIKEVAAHSTGTFSVSDQGVLIDGELIPQTQPYPWENLVPAEPSTIGAGEFVAIQTMHVGSIDSRYFGPLQVSNVIGVVEPVWIF